MKLPFLYHVYRRGPDERGWYEVMLSPFERFENCILYIEKFRQYYPLEHQNYKIEYHPKTK